MRCDTCKHWDPALPDPTYWGHLFGRCQRIVHAEAVRAKVLEEIGGPKWGPMLKSTWADYPEGSEQRYELRKKVENNALREMPAHVADASDYDATLWTKPDFGCVLHEPKDG